MKTGTTAVSLLFLPLCPSPSSFSASLCSFPHSRLFSFDSLRTPRSTLYSSRRRRIAALPIVVFAAQSNLLKAFQTILRVGKDGIKAGTNLVPDLVPRPIARIGVAIVLASVSLFVIKTFLSTAFFVLAMMGLIYFAFVTLNKDEGPKGGGGTGATDEETLEEARRIMEKYK